MSLTPLTPLTQQTSFFGSEFEYKINSFKINRNKKRYIS